jgi:signal transduction histidine kinase
MIDSTSFHSLHDAWILKSKHVLPQKSNLRDDISNELELFFVNMEKTIETGDLDWLEPFMVSWSRILGNSESTGCTNHVTNLINKLMLVTFSICRENLAPEQALNIIDVLIPRFADFSEKTSFLENQLNENKIKDNMAEAQYRLEQLDRSKSNFTSIAAHELKTPLTLIEGYTAMLHENLSRHDEFTNELILLDGIQNGADRLHNIINDMIDVSLIDNRMLKPNIQPVWLNQIISVLSKEFDKILLERNQTLEVISYPGMEAMIFSDPERLLQAFRNILMNAIKFTPDRGSITIDGQKSPGFLETTFKDTGIGIAAEDQRIIFEKFSRLGKAELHSTSKTNFKGGGPGLGLYIAKGIIETLGGRIWAESNMKEGQEFPGTTFHVLLPVDDHNQVQRASKPQETLKK